MGLSAWPMACPEGAYILTVGIERRESSGATAPDALQYPRCYSVRYTVHELGRDRGPAARAVRCAGNAGRGASPTAGKRESFSF
jgi:hypothetical protein